MRFFPFSIFIVIGLLFGSIPTSVAAQTASVGIFAASRAELEQQLRNLETQISAQRQVLEGKQRERVSLERDVAILTAKIEEAKLSIRARTLAIQRLNEDIAAKSDTIGSLDQKMDREKESLGQILRRLNEIGNYSLPEIALSSDSLSDFFADIEPFDNLKQELSVSFVEITETRAVTEEEKQDLEDKRGEELELRQIQELQKRKLDEQEAEKKRILSATRGQEAEYQKLLQGTEQTAAAIRSALFNLEGTAAIPFEKAYAYAKEVQAKLGVRAAFLLGIIAEESNLGKNVGTGTWTVDMHPTRDRPIFAEIARKLGLNPDNLPVSKKPWYGWGGAMGPAQFIPSTWVLYEDRISAMTGHNPPSPWDPYDAFIASGITQGQWRRARDTCG